MDWKKAGEYAKYGLYIIPGYGVYKQIKKPKEKRSTLGTIGFSIYAIGFVAKLVLLPAFISKGVITGNWNLFNKEPTIKEKGLEGITKENNDSTTKKLEF